MAMGEWLADFERAAEKLVEQQKHQEALYPTKDEQIAALTADRDRLWKLLEFYRNRVKLLEHIQPSMPEPGRTLVCDVVANGQLLPNTGDRYGFQTTGREHHEAARAQLKEAGHDDHE